MFTARYGLYLLVQSVDPTQTDFTQPQHIPVTVPRHLRPAVSREICNSRSMTTAVLPYYCTKFAAGRDLGNKVKVTCNRPPWQSNRDAQIATTACPPDIQRTLTAHRVMRSGFDDEKGNMTQYTDFTKAFFTFRMSYGVTASANVIHFAPVSKARPSVRRFSRNSQTFNSNVCADFLSTISQNRTVNVGRAGGNVFTYLAITKQIFTKLTLNSRTLLKKTADFTKIAQTV